MYRIMNRRNLERMFTEEALAQRAAPLSVPTTCIFSRTDGIVAWECCVSEPAPQTENIEVHAAHLGYGHELETLRVIADRLAQPEGRWMPYTRSATTAPPVPPTSLPVAPVATVPLTVDDPDAGGEHGGHAHGRAV
jgi:hypothetical protein